MSENKELFSKHFVQGEILAVNRKTFAEKDVKVFNTIERFRQALESQVPNSELVIGAQFKGLITTEKDPDQVLAFISKQNEELSTKISEYFKEFVIDCGYMVGEDSYATGSYIILSARKQSLSNEILKQI